MSASPMINKLSYDRCFGRKKCDFPSLTQALLFTKRALQLSIEFAKLDGIQDDFFDLIFSGVSSLFLNVFEG
jgi:hypothetical protein